MLKHTEFNKNRPVVGSQPRKQTLEQILDSKNAEIYSGQLSGGPTYTVPDSGPARINYMAGRTTLSKRPAVISLFANNSAIRDAIARANHGLVAARKFALPGLAQRSASSTKRWINANGSTVCEFSNGSTMIINKQGEITKTLSASGVIREFRKDKSSGALQVRFNGQWFCSANLTLLADGTLAWMRSNKEIHECLDGTTRYICHRSGSVIESNSVHSTDIAAHPSGIVFVRKIFTNGTEELSIFKDGELSSRKQVYPAGKVRHMPERPPVFLDQEISA
jgi:hypothetical protein